jgi:hypothetical protein
MVKKEKKRMVLSVSERPIALVVRISRKYCSTSAAQPSSARSAAAVRLSFAVRETVMTDPVKFKTD